MADQTRVAFYGDSYTLGAGASDPSKRWSSRICAQRGWAEFNPGVNGLGFINNRAVFGDGDEPSEVIAFDPGILFITMGLNDNFSYASAADRIRADYISGASHWIEHHPEWMAADGLHPNDADYAQLTVEMDAALKDLGL